MNALKFKQTNKQDDTKLAVAVLVPCMLTVNSLQPRIQCHDCLAANA